MGTRRNKGRLTPAAPTPTRRARLRDLPAAWLAAPLAVGLLLGGLLVGYEPIGGDPDRIYRPIKSELARSLRSGTLPFWSDRFGLGVPLVAESHVAAFYPPNWAAYGLLDVANGYRWLMWLHYAAAALAACAYGRSLGLTPWGGALAGVSFALCGFQAVHSSHEWAYHTLAFLPLSLWMADRWATTGRSAWLAGLALAWGAQLTLGHFQVAMWTAGLCVLTGGWRAIVAGQSIRRAALVPVGLAWGALIAAVQLGPSWELAQIVGQTRRTFGELAFYSFPPAHWAELAIPRLFRSIAAGPEAPYWFGQQTTGFEAVLYVGTVPLILAGIGLIGDGRARGLAPWRLIVPAAFALSTMPRWWPAGYALLLNLPGLGYFRCPARYNAITSLGLALLAGRGLDRAIPARRAWLGFGQAVAFGAAAFAWAAWWSLRPENRASLGDAGLAGRLAIGAASWAVGLAAVAAWRRGRLADWGPFVLTAAELGALFYAGTTRWGWGVGLPGESIVLARLAAGGEAGRVGGVLDNLPVRAGLTTATPYVGFPLPPPNPLLKAVQERRAVGDPASVALLRRLGVTHLVWDGPLELPGSEAVLIATDPALDRLAYRPAGMPERRRWWVVRLDEVWPSARVATRAFTAADRRQLLASWLQAGPADAWFLPADRPPEPSGPRASVARVVSWSEDVAHVEHDGTCDLVIARTAYPGWTARVGSGPARPVVPVDGGLQAVRLEGSGATRVRFAYRSSGFDTAVRMSAVGLVGALGVLAVGPGWGRLRKRAG